MNEERLPQAFGSYLLLDRLGAGGMGTLHLARPIRPKDDVSILVVKRLPAAATEDAERLARFQHEAEIAVSVKSEHVVRVLEVGAVENTPFIAMEHVLGSTLGAIAGACRARKSALPIPVLGRLFVDVLEGLEALHEAIHPATGVPLGVVHRDISPGNLMIAEDRSVLIDLGLGRSNVQTWRTRTGFLMGTPGYIAPEQARGERTDARTDLYGIAVLLWEAITLEHYVPRGELAQMVEVMCDPEPRWRESRTTSPLDALLTKAMSPDPADRFDSARALREALAEASPLASHGELVAAIPDELTAEWKERKQAIDRLLSASSDMDVEEQETKLYAARTVAVTVPLPTFVQTEKRSPFLFAALFALVLSAAATATALLVDPGERPTARRIEEPAIVPRPEATQLEKVDPVIEKPKTQKPKIEKPKIEKPEQVENPKPVQTAPPPRTSPTDLRQDLIRMAADARRMRKAEPNDPGAAERLARINRLLALPSLEGREREIEELRHQIAR